MSKVGDFFRGIKDGIKIVRFISDALAALADVYDKYYGKPTTTEIPVEETGESGNKKK